MILRLLTLSLSLSIVSTGSAAADSTASLVAGSAECTNRDETALLNHVLKLPLFTVWDAPKQAWRTLLPNEGPSGTAAIRIVHLWGTWCGPCKEEFPVLKLMDQQLRADYKGEVQFVYVADTNSSNVDMKDFMAHHHVSMPMGLLFHDDEDKLGADLRGVLPQLTVFDRRNESSSERQLRLPITLLLDQNDVVRQAFVGSVLLRRADLVNGIAQLYRALSSLPLNHKANAASKSGRKRG